MLKRIKSFFKNSRMNAIEEYLAKSEDLVELERRQQELARKGIWV